MKTLLIQQSIRKNACIDLGFTRSEERKWLSPHLKPEGKKVQLVHSLAPALNLTLTLNHLATTPQQTTSTLFGLMYPRTAQRTISIFTTDYKHLRKSRDRKRLPFFRSSERSEWRVDLVVTLWYIYRILSKFR